jgi:two-component system nitrogen regulation response regulator GlnG/two-component system response regulator HydG
VARHLLRVAAEKSPAIAERFFADGEPRIDPDLVEALVQHRYSHHVRELETILWQAIGASKGAYVACSDELREDRQRLEPSPSSIEEPDAETIRAALERHDGKVARAYKELGLKSRYALYRLMKKHDLS